jgi:hypothetical protein
MAQDDDAVPRSPTPPVVMGESKPDRLDFAACAKACGADGFHRERPEDIRPAIQAALVIVKTGSRRGGRRSGGEAG